MSLIINDDHLMLSDIDDNNNILIANYGHVILLPGGSVDENETIT